MIETRHPTNPLIRSGYVHKLLMGLSDDEVAEFIDYWTWQRAQFESDGQRFASWQASKRLSDGRREFARRANS